MRIKENSDSWRASGILKRDFKNDHSDPIARFHSRKNTLKWCRGKVGVKHDVVWRIEKGFFGHAYKTGKCLHCGRIMFSRV